ncbi:phosphoglycolate phosphatase [Pelomonas saccharophila]|uniref:Phosphoglycolate phosphatase n=1 Tax=Roseateles saccharophilus TaxID=304 RepID=A0ABU1YQC7_ROSSA|nr:phosphoglycolate phosphatase [Roseateles saccharophilus]MDR7270411.1 phosphoglycolate phosphatase [Roseateles saccharophilus]
MPTLLPPQACILDLDGTLIDTLGDFVAVLGRVLADLGLAPVTRDFIEHTIGRGSEHLVRTTLAEVGGAPELFDRAWPLYQQHYAALNGEHAAVYPGVFEGLDALKGLGLPLAVLTNKPGAPARELLRRKGLDGYFTHVFGGDAFERKKPDPLPLLKTCEALGQPPSATWMVGDSRNDAEAARAAGCPLVLVTYGYNHGEDIRAVPALQHVGRLDEIPFLRAERRACHGPEVHGLP